MTIEQEEVDDGICRCEDPTWQYVSGEQDVGIPDHYVCPECGGIDEREDRGPPSDPEEWL